MTNKSNAIQTPEQRIAELEQKLAASESEAARLKASNETRNALTLKVSPKGAVSMYGINGRFPVTLYAEQWDRVADHSDQIKAFIAANSGLLGFKSDTAETLQTKERGRIAAGIVARS